MTVRSPLESFTRRPMTLGRSPARSISTPASLSSSLYLPIAVRSSSLGAAPGCGSPLIINITRIRASLHVRTGHGRSQPNVALTRCEGPRCSRIGVLRPRTTWERGSRASRYASRSPSSAPLLRGLRQQGDEYEEPRDRGQEPEQVAPAVAGVAQSSDGHGEVRQQDRDARDTGEQ